MKRFIAIICVMLMVCATQAQVKINNYEYWFDNNYSGKMHTNISIPVVEYNLQTEIPTTGLSNGLHTFHIRFQSTTQNWSGTLSQFFQKLPNSGSTTNNINGYEYWIDNNYAGKVLSNVTSGASYQLIDSIPFASLTNGLHTFHIRFRDERGVWSSVLSQFFQKLPAFATATTNLMTAYEYWVDNNYGTKTSVNLTAEGTIQIIDSLPFGSLSNGLHTFHVRFKDARGSWSSVLSQFFQKLPATTATTANQMTAYEYWLDNNYAGKVEMSVTPSQLYQLVDSLPFAGASNGLHTFHIRFKDQHGQWSTVLSQFFQKLPSSNTGGANQMTAYEYWLDNNYDSKVTIPIAAASIYQLIDSLPFANAANGLHTIHIRFQDQKGQWSTVLSQFFQKLPAISSNIPNLVTAYQYWVDTAAASRTLVNLPDPANPYTLLTDIDLATVPKGNHEFHIQFKDTLGMWSCVLTDTFYKYPTPKAQFIADTYILCDTGTVTFTNQSFDADTLTWHFGDGATSNLTDPTHYFGTPGVYQVKLIASDTTESVTDSITVDINVVQTPVFTLGHDTSMCAGMQLVLDAGAVGDQYLWSTGDTTQSITVTTADDYQLTVTNKHSCLHIDTVHVIVNPLPIVTFSGLDTLYCNTANTVTLSGNPTGGIFNGAGISGSSFAPTTASIGYHTITYSYTNGSGCTDSAQHVTHVISCLNIREFDDQGAFNVYPNPFMYTFNINFTTQKESRVKIKLMDMTNKELEVLMDEQKPEGEYYLYYDGAHLANGIYYLYIIIDDEYAIKRIVRVN